MRHTVWLAALSLGLLTACSDKTKLTDDELRYVRTTAQLLRDKALLPPKADSALIQPHIDSAFRKFQTSRDAYVAFGESLSKEPDRALQVYNAIKDSLGLR